MSNQAKAMTFAEKRERANVLIQKLIKKVGDGWEREHPDLAHLRGEFVCGWLASWIEQSIAYGSIGEGALEQLAKDSE